MTYYLGVDVGGTKTAALIADKDGQAIAYGVGKAGNYEGVGWDGFKLAVYSVVQQALKNAELTFTDINGSGLGIAGYDWPSQKKPHRQALEGIGFTKKFEIVNDAVLGILAGTSNGWGVSVVSGTGCNCRGWSKDRKREGRVVGGASYWSGEYAGGYDILTKAMQAVTYQWAKRGPFTRLSTLFVEMAGAKDVGDLIEGLYVGRYQPFLDVNVIEVFKIADHGDEAALQVLEWAGQELGGMACGVIRQLSLEDELLEVVLIGSIFKGHPMIARSLETTVLQIAPSAKFVHLTIPPVVGAVLLAMEQNGIDGYVNRNHLITTTEKLLGKAHESFNFFG